jgi:hypothetical protein
VQTGQDWSPLQIAIKSKAARQDVENSDLPNSKSDDKTTPRTDIRRCIPIFFRNCVLFVDYFYAIYHRHSKAKNNKGGKDDDPYE